jgi:hypothetical protein
MSALAFEELNRSGLSMLAEVGDEPSTGVDRVKAYIGRSYPDHRAAFAYVRGLLSNRDAIGADLAEVACSEWESLSRAAALLGRAA